MLQTKDLSKKQIRNQKSPPRETTRRGDVEKQSLEHGDVPIFGVCTTLVTETGVPDARLKILRRPVR